MRAFPRGDRLIALADQVLYAGTNFTLTILLAVLSDIEALGRYALVASVSALLHSLFVGFVLEPLTIFGSGKSDARVRSVYSHLAAVTGALVFVVGILLLWASSQSSTEYIRFIALGFILFASQSAVLCAKRIAVIERGVKASALVSIRYSLGAFSTAMILAVSVGYSEKALVFAFFVAGMVSAGGWLLSSIRKRFSSRELLSIFSDVRRYTVWTVISSVPAAVSTHGIFWIAELTADRAIVGQLKLCEQLIIPLGQIFMTMNLLDQIESATEFRANNSDLIRARVRARTWAYLKLAVGYSAAVLASVMAIRQFGADIVEGFVLALAVYCASSLFNAFSVPRNVAAKASRRPEHVAIAYFLMSVTICVIGFAWQPSTPTGLALVLLAGWIVHAISLQASFVALVARPGRS
ncbi:MAG: hypothetical protein QNJ07_06660 [Woeseiaceae bacterium]|nr:hypothetical protein [Woeseiaceae bacterium]